MRRSILMGSLLAIGVAAAPRPVAAALDERFRIGDSPTSLCEAQRSWSDPAATDMFDRAYTIVCRDAAMPVGAAYVLKDRGGDPAARLAERRAARVACASPAAAGLAALPGATATSCRVNDLGVDYVVYTLRRGGKLYASEGYKGYDPALRLALASLVAGRALPGDASLSASAGAAGDAAALARVLAGALESDQALAEGYRRNNSGSYAEAAEFFGSLVARGGQPEALANQALQQSNLGNFREADALLARADTAAGSDPLLARMLRNYRALHLLNQRRADAAIAEVARPVARVATGGAAAAEIDAATAARLNGATITARALGAGADQPLTPEERAAILDAQALQIRGTARRLKGDADGAASDLTAALAQISAVRQGRVASVAWMRAQGLAEMAALSEVRGDPAAAERDLRAAAKILADEYPQSAAELGARLRLAGFLARRGEEAPALAIYRQAVDDAFALGGAAAALRESLAPYFALLARRVEREPALIDDLFRTSQLLIRPGIAETQASLAQLLGAGGDEAARLYRANLSLTRDINRSRVELARLAALTEPTPEVAARIAALRAEIDERSKQQAALQAQLNQSSRYRVVAAQPLALPELREVLKPDEAYYKLVFVGDAAYAILATAGEARAFRVNLSETAAAREVGALRRSIRGDGRALPLFDVRRASDLYQALFGPAGNLIAGVRHLIVEPDGPLMELPVGLLVSDRAGAEAHVAASKRPGSNAYDFSRLGFLAKTTNLSVATSPRAFKVLRSDVPPSPARKAYLGLGQNAPLTGAAAEQAVERGIVGSVGCTWPAAAWNRPISADELTAAQQRLAGEGAALMTGAAFTDVAIAAKDDLSDYRILHFATHGLLAPPQRGCPLRPALMTSLGGVGSDGLLSFREVFDLDVNADLVILSACDTAAGASASEMQAAGVSGGGVALDGLVRAFVGAGGRTVIASHWPVSTRTTQQMMTRLLTADPAASLAQALHGAMGELMRQPATSHPYYWAAFVAIGDGAQPLLRRAAGDLADRR